MSFPVFYGGVPYQRPAPIDRSGERAEDHAERTEARLERALMTMEALWTILRDKLGLSENDLIEKIVEIDMSDGILDGKVRRPPLTCTSCSKTIGRRFVRCLYCGAEVTPDPFS